MTSEAELAIIALLLQQNDQIHRSQLPIHQRSQDTDTFFEEASLLIKSAQQYIIKLQTPNEPAKRLW